MSFLSDHYININLIESAYIEEPHEEEEPFEYSSHGWRVRIIMANSHPSSMGIIVDRDSLEECVELVEKLGLMKF